MNLLAMLLMMSAPVGMAQPVRVGTLHQPSTVVAFYNSQIWKDTLKSKLAEREAAKQAGDTKRATELEQWGGQQQELAHKQLSGEAPITNILEALKPAFPELALKSNVTLIVAELPYAGPQVETVDVTDLLLDWLKSDEKVRKIVTELRKAKRPLAPLH